MLALAVLLLALAGPAVAQNSDNTKCNIIDDFTTNQDESVSVGQVCYRVNSTDGSMIGGERELEIIVYPGSFGPRMVHPNINGGIASVSMEVGAVASVTILWDGTAPGDVCGTNDQGLPCVDMCEGYTGADCWFQLSILSADLATDMYFEVSDCDGTVCSYNLATPANLGANAGAYSLNVSTNNFTNDCDWSRISGALFNVNDTDLDMILDDLHICHNGCGDGSVDGPEECDDGNLVNDDGCNENCIREYCGDGTVQVGIGEECDDGNRVSGDGCSDTCIVEYCGDGTVHVGIREECDDGNLSSDDGCSDVCLHEFCSDGIVQLGIGEACDDGNRVSGDGCSENCILEYCGDGLVQSQAPLSEQCDDGNTHSDDGCSEHCHNESCSDGITQAGIGEECDDGNLSGHDGCSDTCIVEYCGDGTVQVGIGEECDDGNQSSDDGCSSSCLQEKCSDGIVQLGIGEECDDRNLVNEDGCDEHCIFEYCGDGTIQRGIGELCDDNNTISGDGCSDVCLEEFCSDGIVQTGIGEQCDDGNRVNEDGCDEHCIREYCGDGTVQTGIVEECDDGNTISGDGCSERCFREYCSDGITQNGMGEECDDGNLSSDDGCDENCMLEYCGDGIRQTHEDCDDGNTIDGDGCDNNCTDPCIGVVCAALDACHAVGLCDNSGICSNPSKPDGTWCNDGDVDTLEDQCVDGACIGSHICAHVDCSAIDECHADGDCVGLRNGTYECSEPTLPDGEICNDGDPDTYDDRCESGSCDGTVACHNITCPPVDLCHTDGVCVHLGSGDIACTSPAAPDNTTCDDGDAFTQDDLCRDGECVGTVHLGCCFGSGKGGCACKDSITADLCDTGIVSPCEWTRGLVCNAAGRCA